MRPLGNENDKAFALVNALNDAQQQTGKCSAIQVMNLVLGPGTDGKTIEPEGVRRQHLRRRSARCCSTSTREWVDILGPERPR